MVATVTVPPGLPMAYSNSSAFFFNCSTISD